MDCIERFRKRRKLRLDFDESKIKRDKNGRFAPKTGGSSDNNQVKSKSKYRNIRDSLFEKLKKNKGEDATYDPDTEKKMNFESGFQVSFQTSVSEDKNDSLYLSDEDYDKTVEKLAKETGSKAYVGKFDEPEISFHCETMEQAMDIAKKYNQHSIMDWKRFNELKDDWTDANDLIMFPRNPFYDPSKNHVKGE